MFNKLENHAYQLCLPFLKKYSKVTCFQNLISGKIVFAIIFIVVFNVSL